MGPNTLKLFLKSEPQFQQTILNSPHFLIDKNVMKAIGQVTERWYLDAEIDSSSFRFQFDGRAPSTTTFIETVGGTFVWELFDEGDTVHITVYDMKLEDPAPYMLRYAKRDLAFEAFDPFGAPIPRTVTSLGGFPPFSYWLSAAIHLDILLTLIAEPRVVNLRTPRRSARRQARRLVGAKQPVRWHSVSWTIGEKIVPSCSHARKQFRQPLHYCRAHWRRTHKEAPKAEARRGHDGHWCWVQGCFKGHPDYGVKLASYEPHVDPLGVSEPVLAALTA